MVPPPRKAFQMPSIWLRSSPCSAEAAVVPAAMVARRGGRTVAIAGGAAIPDAEALPGVLIPAGPSKAATRPRLFSAAAMATYKDPWQLRILIPEGFIGQIPTDQAAQLRIAELPAIFLDQCIAARRENRWAGGHQGQLRKKIGAERSIETQFDNSPRDGTIVWVQSLDQQIRSRKSLIKFRLWNPVVKAGSRNTSQAESNPLAFNRLRCCGRIGAIKAPRPKRSFHFFRHCKGRPQPQIWWRLGGWRIGCFAYLGRSPSSQIHQSHQAEKHPGKSKALNTSNTSTSQPSGKPQVPWSHAFCLIVMSSNGESGTSQSRFVPAS